MLSVHRLNQILLLALLLITGCAGGNSPSAPPIDTITPDLTQQASIDTAPIDSGHFLWAYHEILIDPLDKTYEIVTPRSIAPHWNVLRWLEQWPCTDCLSIEGITPSPDGTLLIDIAITHPFDNPNMTGFDVRGIAMFNGSGEFPESGLTYSVRTEGDGELVNADGYTTLYNPTTAGSGPDGLQGFIEGKLGTITLPNALLNGYRRHVSIDPSNTRNAFYAGEAVVTTYEIDMPDGAFVLGYAVDASWAPAINKPVSDPMVDFGSDANCPEPWKIEVTQNPVGQGLTDNGGSTVLYMDVYDRSGKDTHHDPVIECVGLFDGNLTASWTEDGDGFSRYEVTVENTLLASVGDYRALISVEDVENETAPDWLDLTSYWIEILNVTEWVIEYFDPVAIADFSPNPQLINEPVHFIDDGSYDPDGGSISVYEWDFNNDGVYDEEGPDVYHTWEEAGVYEVQFRVTDDENMSTELDEPLIVNIESAPPIAIAGVEPNPQTVCEQVHFFDDGSYDPDGGIIKYEWDWNNDGTYDEESEDTYHTWDVPGVYSVQFRVTSDDLATDELDEPIEIIIENALPTASAVADKYSVEPDELIQFDGSASTDNDCSNQEIILFQWDWENDGIFDDTGQVVSHSYDSQGFYQVQLRVTDDENEWSQLPVPIGIGVAMSPLDPLAYATADPVPQTVCETVHFSDDGSYDPDGGLILTYEWDWNNDGVYDEEGADVDHSWDSPGTYYVQFRVTDDESATSELTDPIEIVIENAPPEASADADKYTAKIYETVNFDASSSFDNDCSGHEITLYEWDWDYSAAFVPDETGITANQSWDTTGVHIVQLRVTDNEGASSLLAEPLEITVENNPPTVNITNCPAQDINGTTYTFEWTGSDDILESWELEYNISLDGAFLGWQTGLTEYEWNSLSCGPHTFVVRVRDNGNPQLIDEDTCNFAVNLGPSIQITNCPSLDVNTTSYTFTWAASDDLDAPWAMSYNVERDSVWQGWQTGLTDYQWNSLSSGPHTFRVRVRDTGNPGLIDEDICNFTVNFKPSVAIDDCPTEIQPTSVEFNWTGTDDLSSESSMSYSWKLDAETWSTWQVGQLTIMLEDLTDGDHTFYVRVRDTGNPQLTCETAPASCDSCFFAVSDDCSNPPGNVTNFSASDGDPSLNPREIELNWNPVEDCALYYDVYRHDYSESTGWQWTIVQTIDHPVTTWTDTDVRYSGSANPVEYRIRARNDAGNSPDFTYDTGYPKFRQMKIAMWCAADDDSGTNAVISWTIGMANFNNANEFWNGYGINFVLENPSGFAWMTNPAYRHETGNEDTQMHEEFGQITYPDCINTYFIETSEGSYTRGFARTMCPGSSHTTENIFIVMCRDHYGEPPDENFIGFAHELGHAVGRFHDIYLLDANQNFYLDDGVTCDNFTWCTTPPLVPPLFCDEDAAYPLGLDSFDEVPKQLMWYSYLGRPVSDYDLFETQWFWFDDWLHGYESNYPSP